MRAMECSVGVYSVEVYSVVDYSVVDYSVVEYSVVEYMSSIDVIRTSCNRVQCKHT